MRQIKHDLAQYAAYEASLADMEPLPTACRGEVNFKVTSVAVALTTVIEVSSSGEAAAEIPIGGITLGPSGSYGRTRNSSQTISFTVVPVPDEGSAAAAVVPPEPGSFYAVLRGLRESLLKASDTRPCLSFPEADKQENSIEFGFTVTRDRSAGGKISFLIFSLGAERKSSQAVGNTVTVSFVADGSPIFIQ